MEKKIHLASIYRRGIAFMIDEFILALVRALAISCIAIFCLAKNIHDLGLDLKEKLLSIPDNPTPAELLSAFQSIEIASWMILIAFVFIIIGPLYAILIYRFKNGKTIGKAALGLRVIRSDGGDLSFGDIVARVVFSYIPWFLPMLIYYLYNINNSLWLLCFIIWFFWYDPWIFVGQRNKAIHDTLSMTCVVHED